MQVNYNEFLSVKTMAETNIFTTLQYPTKYMNKDDIREAMKCLEYHRLFVVR